MSMFLSLEFCGGGSVEDLIRLSDGPLTESEIGWIMSQVLLGVEFLHSKDHVHGDIKASNILLMVDGHVKLGGSGSVLDHKTGAGERRRRRRALTMAELPLSWLAPEATPILSNPPGARVPRDSASIPFASAETDIWALGIACIELFQGRPPKPDTPILKWLEEPRFAGQTAAGNYMGGFSTPLGMTGNVTGGSIGGWGSIQTGVRDFRTEMSEEMWSFVGRCLTPDPMARPRVRDLLEDAFILKYNRPSAELQERIQRMMEFVDQCAFISSDRQSNDSMSISSPSSFSSASTLSPTSPTFMDLRLQEANIGPWLIPMVRPRVDLVYDASTFFDEAGLPMSPPDPDTTNTLSSWKHQRASHPVVKQALKCEQAGYMIFRHSRSPSLATIVESQLEDDPYQFIRDVGGRPRMDYGGRSLDLLYA
ncbi:kinase-like domain-containing protein [Mortierella sp. GBAus27b]|nr:kinase-like domain-containing protein [Mortierella sp. GBAus27b]